MAFMPEYITGVFNGYLFTVTIVLILFMGYISPYKIMMILNNKGSNQSNPQHCTLLIIIF